MLMIFYGDIPMCASCSHISIGTAHYSNGDQRICVCRFYKPYNTVIRTFWNSKCNLYKNSYSNVYNIINTFG